MHEKLAELIATIIFVAVSTVIHLAYYFVLDILIIWVVRGLSGLDLSHAFLHILVGIIVYKAIQAPIKLEIKYEPKRKN